jgi:hypothetical protein
VVMAGISSYLIVFPGMDNFPGSENLEIKPDRSRSYLPVRPFRHRQGTG